MNEHNPYAPPQAGLEQPHGNELGGRGARLGASLIDGLLIGAVLWPAMYFAGFFDHMDGGTPPPLMTVAFALLGIVVFLLIHGYLLATAGQTVGKRLLGLRIVSVDREEIVPLPKLYLLRYLPMGLAYYVPLIGPLLNLANLLFIFRKDRRCIHDLLAGTKVVRVRPESG